MSSNQAMNTSTRMGPNTDRPSGGSRRQAGGARRPVGGTRRREGVSCSHQTFDGLRGCKQKHSADTLLALLASQTMEAFLTFAAMLAFGGEVPEFGVHMVPRCTNDACDGTCRRRHALPEQYRRNDLDFWKDRLDRSVFDSMKIPGREVKDDEEGTFVRYDPNLDLIAYVQVKLLGGWVRSCDPRERFFNSKGHNVAAVMDQQPDGTWKTRKDAKGKPVEARKGSKPPFWTYEYLVPQVTPAGEDFDAEKHPFATLDDVQAHVRRFYHLGKPFRGILIPKGIKGGIFGLLANTYIDDEGEKVTKTEETDFSKRGKMGKFQRTFQIDLKEDSPSADFRFWNENEADRINPTTEEQDQMLREWMTEKIHPTQTKPNGQRGFSYLLDWDRKRHADAMGWTELRGRNGWTHKKCRDTGEWIPKAKWTTHLEALREANWAKQNQEAERVALQQAKAAKESAPKNKFAAAQQALFEDSSSSSGSDTESSSDEEDQAPKPVQTPPSTSAPAKGAWGKKSAAIRRAPAPAPRRAKAPATRHAPASRVSEGPVGGEKPTPVPRKSVRKRKTQRLNLAEFLGGDDEEA